MKNGIFVSLKKDKKDGWTLDLSRPLANFFFPHLIDSGIAWSVATLARTSKFKSQYR